MLTDYPNISLSELDEAHADAIVGDNKIDIRAFGGVYTVNIFSEVMHRWKLKRNRILAAIIEYEQKDKPQIDQAVLEQKRSAFRQQVIDWFESEVTAPTVTDWKQLNQAFCNELIEAKYIPLQNAQLWADAKAETTEQVKHERIKAERLGDYQAIRRYIRQLSDELSETDKSDLSAIRISIYAKLLVMDALNERRFDVVG